MRFSDEPTTPPGTVVWVIGNDRYIFPPDTTPEQMRAAAAVVGVPEIATMASLEERIAELEYDLANLRSQVLP